MGTLEANCTQVQPAADEDARRKMQLHAPENTETRSDVQWTNVRLKLRAAARGRAAPNVCQDMHQLALLLLTREERLVLRQKSRVCERSSKTAMLRSWN